jgi:hypothetical protein
MVNLKTAAALVFSSFMHSNHDVTAQVPPTDAKPKSSMTMTAPGDTAKHQHGTLRLVHPPETFHDNGIPTRFSPLSEHDRRMLTRPLLYPAVSEYFKNASGLMQKQPEIPTPILTLPGNNIGW